MSEAFVDSASLSGKTVSSRRIEDDHVEAIVLNRLWNCAERYKDRDFSTAWSMKCFIRAYEKQP